MTQTVKMSWDDTVLPFQLDASDIRGRVARLDVCWIRCLRSMIIRLSLRRLWQR